MMMMQEMPGMESVEENTGSTNALYDEETPNGNDNKLLTKSNGEDIAKSYPGPINETPGFDSIVIEEAYLKHSEDARDTYQLKLDTKEDEHYVLLPHSAWLFLFDVYEGINMPRYSIELAVDADEEGVDGANSKKREFMIEIYLKKVQIYILPKIESHLCLRQPAAVYISRRASVLDFRVKLAEILR